MAGRRIDDHSFWAGKGGKESPMPMQSKMRQEKSAEGGAAHVGMDYPDTTEAIERDQDHSASKAKAHKMKAGYRY